MPTTTTRRRPRKTKRKRVARPRFRPMTPENQSSIIDQIDTKQNQLLEELDELNRRVEQVLGEWTKDSSAEKKATL